MLKRVIDKVFDLNSKRLESFNKKQVNKNVNLVIKEESTDFNNRRIKLRKFLVKLYFHVLN